MWARTFVTQHHFHWFRVCVKTVMTSFISFDILPHAPFIADYYNNKHKTCMFTLLDFLYILSCTNVMGDFSSFFQIDCIRIKSCKCSHFRNKVCYFISYSIIYLPVPSKTEAFLIQFLYSFYFISSRDHSKFSPHEFFTIVLNVDLPQNFEWQQLSSDLQDCSKYVSLFLQWVGLKTYSDILFPQFFSKPLRTVSKTQITNDITVSFMFHRFFRFLAWSILEFT